MERLAESIRQLKSEFVGKYTGNSHINEVIPIESTKQFPINEKDLEMLHKFAQNNPVYFNAFELKILDVPCMVYEGDINDYWLNSLKHDTSYAPFYPTWILSAYTLALEVKKLGYEQVVDIGSGDGRIAFFNQFLGITSFGIEIDESLIELQKKISTVLPVQFDSITTDATQFDYSKLNLSKPIFFIGGLPKVGEMLANNVIQKIKEISELEGKSCFVLTGTHSLKEISPNDSSFGWKKTVEAFGLRVMNSITLPTRWTIDQKDDTPYVFTK